MVGVTKKEFKQFNNESFTGIKQDLGSKKMQQAWKFLKTHEREVVMLF